MAQQLSTNTFGCAKWIVSADATQGTHTTIGAALTAASSGDTIFIRPGTYTENPTLKAGVSLTANACDGFANVIITGKCSFSGAGIVAFSGILFLTNSDYAISVTGSSNSSLYFTDCAIVATNHTAVLLNSSGVSSIFFESSTLDISTTGITYYSMTAGNNIHFIGCFLNNSGSSVTASSNSAGAVLFESCSTFGTFSSTSAGSLGFFNSNIDSSGANSLTITANGTGSNVVANCYVAGGTASCFSVGVGAVLAVSSTTTNTSNTNVAVGSGQLTYVGLSNLGTKAYSTTTLLGGTLTGGVNQAPSAGYLGEQIRSFVPLASAVSVPNATGTNITSIALTAGIWDISAIGVSTGTLIGTYNFLAISTVSATLPASTAYGDNVVFTPTMPTVSCNLCQAIPSYRVTLTASTPYYLVAQIGYTSGTATGFGRISATRVG